MPVQPDFAIPFFSLHATLGAGSPLPHSGWVRLADTPLLILVGVTGVGKSTTLERLLEQTGPATLLPDRRALTDRLIISAMQAADGLPVTPVSDRAQRFAFTRAFRERYPGGMAQALTLLAVDRSTLTGPLIFDGLRGENEVRFALDALPHARLAMLHAPDGVRVLRLLRRHDPLDRIGAGQPGTVAQPGHGLAALGVDLPAGLFTPEEERTLLRLLDEGAFTEGELRTRLAIVADERRSYDPESTRRALDAAGPDRALTLDTTQGDPAAMADRIFAAMRMWGLVA